jgi:hypothetical protein
MSIPVSHTLVIPPNLLGRGIKQEPQWIGDQPSTCILSTGVLAKRLDKLAYTSTLVGHYSTSITHAASEVKWW